MSHPSNYSHDYFGDCEDEETEAIREQYNFKGHATVAEHARVLQDLWAVIARDQLNMHLRTTTHEAGHRSHSGPAERIRILRRAGHVLKRDNAKSSTVTLPTIAGVAEIEYRQKEHQEGSEENEAKMQHLLSDSRWQKIRDALKAKFREMAIDPEYQLDFPLLTASEAREHATSTALRCLKQFEKEAAELAAQQQPEPPAPKPTNSPSSPNPRRRMSVMKATRSMQTIWQHAGAAVVTERRPSIPLQTIVGQMSAAANFQRSTAEVLREASPDGERRGNAEGSAFARRFNIDGRKSRLVEPHNLSERSVMPGLRTTAASAAARRASLGVVSMMGYLATGGAAPAGVSSAASERDGSGSRRLSSDKDDNSFKRLIRGAKAARGGVSDRGPAVRPPAVAIRSKDKATVEPAVAKSFESLMAEPSAALGEGSASVLEAAGNKQSSLAEPRPDLSA